MKFLRWLLVGIPVLGLLSALWWLQQSNVNSLNLKVTKLEKQIDDLPTTVTPKYQMDHQIAALKQQIDTLPITIASKQQLNLQIAVLKQQISTLSGTVDPKDKLSLKKDQLTLDKEQVNAQNAIYVTLAQAFESAFFFLVVYLTWRNTKVSEEKQVTERFSTAVALLESNKLEVRVGGIYALERISKGCAEKNYWTIMEVLTGFVRERSQLVHKEEKAADSLGVQTRWKQKDAFETQSAFPIEEEKQLIPPTDIQAVMIVLNRRDRAYWQGEKERLNLSFSNFSWMILTQFSFKAMNLQEANLQKADLHDVDLSRADLSRADLSRANLIGANLSAANLNEADLSAANLNEAKLSEANLSGANLKGANLRADLSEANLIGANLIGANLSKVNLFGNLIIIGANLSGANLSKADLIGANFRGANLSQANLSGADLSQADLSKANLSGANLKGANLSEANLKGANLKGADLRGANLSETIDFIQKQLSRAETDEHTKFPSYLSTPKRTFG